MTTTSTATETRVRIGKGNHVHRGNADGNTYCGSQARTGRRSGVSFLAADTTVTCTKCGADTAVAPTAPVARADRPLCPNHSYPMPLLADGTCGLCD